MFIPMRKATGADAELIHEIHARSIRGMCAKNYSPAQVESWVRFRSVEEYRKAIESGQEENWIAEGGPGVGAYATFVGDELTALFVDPDSAGCGAGKGLLALFELKARRAGLSRVTLQSTLTSRGFYEGKGYGAIGTESYMLPDGVTIECVRMTKDLSRGV
jgi:GNAT superfamily N-acetyltransferase